MDKISYKSSLRSNETSIFDKITNAISSFPLIIKNITNTAHFPNRINLNGRIVKKSEKVDANKALKEILDIGKHIHREAIEVTQSPIQTQPNINHKLSLKGNKGLIVGSLLLLDLQKNNAIHRSGHEENTTNLMGMERGERNYNDTIHFHRKRRSVSESLNLKFDMKTNAYLDHLRERETGFIGKKSYIGSLVFKLEAKGWPLDFNLLKNRFEKDKSRRIKIINKSKNMLKEAEAKAFSHRFKALFGQPINYLGRENSRLVNNEGKIKKLKQHIAREEARLTKETENLSVLNLLLHPDNPNFSTAWMGFYKKIDYLYAEKNKIDLECKEYSQHLESLPKNSNPIAFRYISSEKYSTEVKLANARKEYKLLTAKINSMEAAASIEMSQNDLKSQLSLETQMERIAAELKVTQVNELELENNVKNAKEELDKLILSGLLVNGINIDCTDLDKVWQVHFYQGANFKGSISFSNTIKEFSLRKVLLGEADRSIFIHVGGSQSILKINSKNNDAKNETLLKLLNDKKSRLNIADSVMSEIENSAFKKIDDIDFIDDFKFSVHGKILHVLSKSSQQLSKEPKIYQHIIEGFISGLIKPSVVLFEGKVVPGLLSLGSEHHNLIFSLPDNDLIISSTFHENKKLAKFIHKHLTKIDQEGFSKNNLENIKHIDNRLNQKWQHRLTFIERSPNIQFKTEPEIDPYRLLLKSGVEKNFSDLNGVIYTSYEKTAKLSNDVKKILIESAEVIMMLTTTGVSSPWIISAEFMAGISLKLANIYLDMQLIENSDRGADIEQAKKNLMVGKIYLSLNLAKAPRLMVQVIGKWLDLINTLEGIAAERLFNPLAKYSKFRVNRGGDDLATTAFRYAKLDQFSFPNLLKKKHPDGLCHGLSLEILQRLEESVDPQKHLFSVVASLKEDLKKPASFSGKVFDSIERKQTQPSLFKTQKYHREPTVRYRGEHHDLVKKLEDDVMELNPGDTALIRAYIRKSDGSILSEGHIIMVQRISNQQFELFDSNNGVFSYSTETGFKKALMNYFNLAYRDHGLLIPGSFTRFIL
ncbi:hypothetical protein [Providencia huashanensis]|uniref:hypothetical protein n=1 Tax=Providencia huashanensis TaxID=3037798 RepID=UPI003D2B6727